VDESQPKEAAVPSWLWRAAVALLSAILVAGMGLVIALALGWRSPTPRRAPDWTLGELSWTAYGDAFATSTLDSYRLRLSQPNERAWVVAHPPIDAFELEVDVHSQGDGSEVDTGVLYRYRDAENHYRFAIDRDGYYTIAIIRAGKLSPIRDWQQWPHIRRGDTTNRLRVYCKATLCRFYINNEFLTEVRDDTFLSGSLSLWAENSTDTTSEVVFGALHIWSIDD
jgi:hypothetical protein